MKTASEEPVVPELVTPGDQPGVTPIAGVRRVLRVLDVLLLVAFVSLGASAGGLYYSAATSSGLRPVFYQSEFAAAVLEACGRGFVRPPANTPPALGQFLKQEVASFDCGALPKDLRLFRPIGFQIAFRYLMFVVAMYWKATEVSWAHLWPIFAAVHGAVAGLAYLALRVGFARSLAALLALAIAVSPAQLSLLPHLRDSAKAPFFMAVALVVLLVWARPLTLRRTVALGGVFGLIVGVGLGFRPDVVLWFPLLAIALFCAPDADLKHRVVRAIQGLSVAAAVFVVVGLPILLQYKSGSNFGHVAILGFTKPFDEDLGVRGGPYSVGYFYNDAYVVAMVNSYARRVHGQTAYVDLGSPLYERYASNYFWEIVRAFPADLTVRTGASVAGVLNLPFKRGPYPVDVGLQRLPWLRAIADARVKAFAMFDGLGVWLFLAAFLMLAARGLMPALGFAISVLYLAGLPVLQFNLRHYFQLEILGLFALGLVVEGAVRSIRGILKRRLREESVWPDLRPAAIRVSVCVCVIGAIPFGLDLLRARQQRSVNALIAAYDLEAVELPYSTQATDSDRVVIVPEGVVRDADRGQGGTAIFFKDDLVMVDLSNACDALSLTMRIKYRVVDPFVAGPRDAFVKLWPTREHGQVRLVIPIYQTTIYVASIPDYGFLFQGLEFTTRSASCLAGLKRVPNAAHIPLWLDLYLDRNWRQEPLYQTNAGATVPSQEPQIYLAPPRLDLRVSAIDTLSSPAPDFRAASKVAKIDHPAGATVQGVAESPFAYLILGKAKAVAAGAQVLGTGELFEGGLTLGLLKDGLWSQTVNVNRPGRFIAAVEAPADGEYVAVVANFNQDAARPTRFVMDKLGWFAGSAAPSRHVP